MGPSFSRAERCWLRLTAASSQSTFQSTAMPARRQSERRHVYSECLLETRSLERSVLDDIGF